MSLPDSNKNDANKMKNPPNGSSGESPMTRLQRSVGGGTPKKTEPAPKAETPKSSPAASSPASKPKKEAKPRTESTYTVGKYKFGPAFWTIASVASLAVNIVLIIVLAILLQNFKTVGVTLTTVPNHLLGGLYNNFVKMDQAHIITTIPVSKEIPVVFTLNVSGTTNVTLTDNVRIDGALVTVHTGGLNITNASASIVLPKDTVLPIYIENLQVPVDQKVLAELSVPVDIPLNQTDLHVPFVGLQEVVKPFYCLIEPQAQIDGVNVCQ
jgi:hypothetical protein